MRRTLLAAAAALALSGSANAAMLLGQDANGHKQVINTDAPAAQTEVHAARIAQPAAGLVSPAFLLGEENGQKRVVNQYAGDSVATYGARIAAPAAEAVDRGFLLSADDNDGKRVINQYAR